MISKKQRKADNRASVKHNRSIRRYARKHGVRFDFHRIVKDLEHIDFCGGDCGGEHDKDVECRSTYVGSVLSCFPSHKIWMFWTTNQSKIEMEADEYWREQQEKLFSSQAIEMYFETRDDDCFATQYRDR